MNGRKSKIESIGWYPEIVKAGPRYRREYSLECRLQKEAAKAPISAIARQISGLTRRI